MTLKILPHGRLQEWVAEEQGYFAAEGLEYSFIPEGDYGVPPGQVGVRRLRDLRGRGAAAPTSAARATGPLVPPPGSGPAAPGHHGLFGGPCAILVPPESPVRGPADLAGVPVGVGYHSGSHFATVQALGARARSGMTSPSPSRARPTTGSTRCWTARYRQPPYSGSRCTLRRPSASARSSTPPS